MEVSRMADMDSTTAETHPEVPAGDTSLHAPKADA